MPEPSERKLTQKQDAGPPLSNSRQELFAQFWFKGETKENSAILAGYKAEWARSIGSRLSTNVNILARYNELQKQTADASIMTVKERRQRLSEFGREDIRNSAGTLIRHGSIAAMDLLNKMDGDYAPQKVDLTEGLTELLGQLRGRVVPEIAEKAEGD